MDKNIPAAFILGLEVNGLGIARSLAKHKIPVVCIDSNFTNPPGFTFCCKKIIYPNLYNDNLIDFLIELAKKQTPKPVLFITIDENVKMVSRYRDSLKKYFHFNLPDENTIETLINKKLFSDFAQEKGFCVPKTFWASNTNEILDLAEKIPYPCILKPFCRSEKWEKSGVKKTFKIFSLTDLIETYGRISHLKTDVIIQEWIDGPDSAIYFCLLYFNANSEPVAHFEGRKIRQWQPECGSTSLAISCEQNEVLHESIRLFETIGYKGMGSVEFKRDAYDEKFKITEPTVGRSNLQSALALACGINIPYIAYMDILGRNSIRISKQVNGIKWVNESADLNSALHYVKSGELSIKQWLVSLKGRKVFAIFSLSDPLPGIFLLLFLLQRVIAKIYKMIDSLIIYLYRKIDKRKVVAKSLVYSGFLKSVCFLRKKLDKKRLTILAYHRVLDYIPDADFKLDENVVDATKDDFEKQINWLCRYFNIITFQSLLKVKNKPNSLIITFDDGYKDNFEVAYPILKKYGVPAVIFLSSGYIGGQQLFWWDEIAYLIKKTNRQRLIVELTEGNWDFSLISLSQRMAAINALHILAKNISNASREDMLNILRKQLGVSIANTTTSETILNWEEVKKMSKNGMEFGSHTVSHPILSNVTEDVARFEIVESKKKIEKEIGKEIIAFSYPVGGETSFNQATEEMLNQAGFSFAVNYIHGKNIISNLNKFNLYRIHMDKEDNLSVFKAKITFPGIIKY